MAVNKEFLIKVNADINSAVSKMDTVGYRIKSLGRNIVKLGSIFGGISFGLAFTAVTKATREQEAAVAQLEQRLKSTGGISGQSAKELTEYAGSLQKVTTFGDEAIISMQSLLLTFTNIRGGVFNEATEAILDMSVAMGQDLKSSALQLGKALNDPISGIEALSRVGVRFTDHQKDVIKSLVKTGNTAKAQKIILQELKTEFGGAARAARDTFGGALDGLKNAFGDLLEAKGGLNEAKDTIEGFTKLLSDPATIQAMDGFASAIIRIGAAAASTLVEIGAFVANVWELAGVLSSRQGINYQTELDSDAQREYLSLLKKRHEMLQLITVLENSGATDGSINSVQAGIIAIEQKLAEMGWVKGGKGAYEIPFELSVVGGGDIDKPPPTDPADPPKTKTSPFAAALEDMQRQIALLSTTTQHEKTLWEVQNGRYKSLSEQQQQALLDAATALDVKAEAIRQLDEQIATEEAYTVAQEQAAQAWRDLLNPMEEVDQQLEQLDRLLKEGRISWDTYAEGVFHTMDAMDEVPDKVADTASELSVFADEAARNMQGAFADFLFDPFDKGLAGMLRPSFIIPI